MASGRRMCAADCSDNSCNFILLFRYISSVNLSDSGMFSKMGTCETYRKRIKISVRGAGAVVLLPIEKEKGDCRYVSA